MGDDSHQPKGPRHRELNAAVVAAVGLVVAAAVTGLLALASSGGGGRTSTVNVTGGHSTNRDPCVGGGAYVAGTVNCAPPGRRPEVPVTADAGCGTFGGSPGTILRFKVLMWCAPTAVRGQYQYKLKVSVKNTGNVRTDIRRQRFVLLWRTVDRRHWTPPRGGAPAPPRKLVYAGRDYWAISANLDGVAEPRPAHGDYTFATHWDHTWLAAGTSSLRLRKGYQTFRYEDGNHVARTIRFNYHDDDLVFYVPARTVNRDRNFLGLGYEKGGRIIGLCPQQRWGPKVPPSIF
jgi:hypothetical protein